MDGLKGLLWGLAVCFVLWLLCGCVTRYVAVPEWRYRDSVRTEYVRDSVIRHDSVYVNRYTQGDTTYLTKTVIKYVYKDRLVRDTVAVVRRDSVAVPAPAVDGAESRGMSRWQAFLLHVGLAVCLAGIGCVVAWVARALRK